MSQDSVDVLIAGAGPVGTALAIDLTRRGLSIRIVDKAAQAFHGSRAKGVQPRTLEVFEDLGVLDDVHANGGLYPKLGIHLGPVTIPWSMSSMRAPSPAVPYPSTWLIPQSRTDAALHEQLRQLGGHIEFNCEFQGFTQDHDSVSASIITPDGVQRVSARYLVGADGASSVVRKTAGIGFSGTTDEADRILIIDAVTTGLSRDRWHMWPTLRGRFVGACPLPHSDLFQWMIRLNRDEQPPEGLAQISARIQSQIRNTRITLDAIHWQSVFRPNVRLAEHYRRGRVFIAGDAAHVHTLAGAQGLNTGVQDAYNLGWKFGQVLAGADEGLLNSYEAERQPVAAGVLGLSTKKYEGLSKLDPASIKRGDDERQIKLTYQGGPLAPATAPCTTTLRVGDRAPDARVRRADGIILRLFDLLRGPGFTAIAQGPRAAQALRQLAWPSNGAGLTEVVINAGSTDFTDSRHTFCDAYGTSGDALFLIRPDGYIGHIAVQDMLRSTQDAVMRLAPPAQQKPAGTRSTR